MSCFPIQKLRFFQRKVLRTLLTGRSNYKARLCLAEFSPLYSTTFDKKISPTSGLYFLLMAGTTRLVLDYWRFTTFTLRFCFSYEKQHSVKLFTGTAFRSLSFTSALPKSAELAKAILTTINSAIKKSHTRWLLLMAGTTRLS